MPRSVEESPGRLGLDRVEVLHIHDPRRTRGKAVPRVYLRQAELTPTLLFPVGEETAIAAACLAVAQAVFAADAIDA
jgi:aryl-alcohol dehydrogenase-like predicted oxidoreductase